MLLVVVEVVVLVLMMMLLLLFFVAGGDDGGDGVDNDQDDDDDDNDDGDYDGGDDNVDDDDDDDDNVVVVVEVMVISSLKSHFLQHVQHSLCPAIDCIPDCLNGGVCVDGLCQCARGLQGDRCQTDIDECLTVSDGCKGHCRNTFGGFECVCPLSLTLGEDGRSCIPRSEQFYFVSMGYWRLCAPSTITYDVITPIGSVSLKADNWLASPVSPSAILVFLCYGLRPPERARSA
ncbi:epidermal growth factor-like protein 7 [Elysia marginata]|uniref:Epidermal growth factor-like protein 7 n=1 Tax=Elysia marginata TaxID=1093978 RepID=A0AAV4JHT5_9GAST|nr:epidermal growth factor-like protein 7 [Elysia marginata]